MTRPDLPLREAARAIVLDTEQRVLLLYYAEHGGFWATPGGALQQGESHAAAVIRELYEELGIDDRVIEVGAQLAERSTAHLVGTREVRQIERYFLVSASP